MLPNMARMAGCPPEILIHPFTVYMCMPRSRCQAKDYSLRWGQVNGFCQRDWHVSLPAILFEKQVYLLRPLVLHFSLNTEDYVALKEGWATQWSKSKSLNHHEEGSSPTGNTNIEKLCEQNMNSCVEPIRDVAATSILLNTLKCISLNKN